MTSDGRRVRRVAETIRAELTTVIQRELADPQLALLVITDVEVAEDFGVAWVSVRSLEESSDSERKKLIKALERASGRLKRALMPRIRLRKFPELRFRHDVGQDNARRVEELLREIDDEPRGSSDE